MGYVFLILLVATGLVVLLVVDQLIQIMSAGVYRWDRYLLATFAIMIGYAALCLVMPPPNDPHFGGSGGQSDLYRVLYAVFAAVIFGAFATLTLRERRLYRRWRSRSDDATLKARTILRWATPVLAALLVINSVGLAVPGIGLSSPGGSPSPVIGPSSSVTSRPTPNGQSVLSIVDGRTDPAARTFSFTAVVDLTSLTKASPALDQKNPFTWTLVTSADPSLIHLPVTVGGGSSISGTASSVLSCAVTTSNPAALVLKVVQGVNSWPAAAQASLRIPSNTCPLVTGFRLGGPMTPGTGDTANLLVIATVQGTSGALAWSLVGLASDGTSVQLSAGSANMSASGNLATLSVGVSCSALNSALGNGSKKNPLVLNIRDGIGLVGWGSLPTISAVTAGVCGH